MTLKPTTNSNAVSEHMPVTVITTCYGRNRHLYNLLSSLANGSVQPDEVIIVNDDADPKRLADFPLNIVKIPTSAGLVDSTNHKTLEHPTFKKQDKTEYDIGHKRTIGAARPRPTQMH